MPILVLPIADPIKARAKLKAVLGDESASVKREYQGIEIQELSTQSYFKFAAVLDRQTLILTTDASPMEQVIDTYTGEPSVIDTPGYRQALSKIDNPQPFIRIYLNSVIAEPLIAANTIQASVPQGFDFFLLGGQGVAANVYLNSQGLSLQGVSWLRNDAEITYQRSKPINQILSQLPQETTMMIAGGSFKQLWNMREKRSQLGVQGDLNPETIRLMFASATDLDIDKSLVDWMTGNFALAIASTPSTLESPSMNGLVLLAEVGDKAIAQKAFSDLDEMMKKRHKFQVTSEKVSDMDITVWSQPLRPTKFTRGILDSGVAFLSISNMNETLMVKPSISLKENPVFQNATAHDFNAVDGYFFLDIESIVKDKSPLLYSLLLPLDLLVHQIGKDLTHEGIFPKKAISQGAVNTIGLTTAFQDEKTVQFNLSVLMPVLEGPGTLPDPSTDADGVEEEGPEGQ